MGPMVAIKSAGTMPDDERAVAQWWENELDPTPSGFRLLANKAFAPELKKLNLV